MSNGICSNVKRKLTKIKKNGKSLGLLELFNSTESRLSKETSSLAGQTFTRSLHEGGVWGLRCNFCVGLSEFG